MEGGATGADNLARRWALARGIEVAMYRADLDRYQHRAGAAGSPSAFLGEGLRRHFTGRADGGDEADEIEPLQGVW
jgi:hypothetical protein